MATECNITDDSARVANNRHCRCHNAAGKNRGLGGASFQCREHKGWQPQVLAHFSLQ